MREGTKIIYQCADCDLNVTRDEAETVKKKRRQHNHCKPSRKDADDICLNCWDETHSCWDEESDDDDVIEVNNNGDLPKECQVCHNIFQGNEDFIKHVRTHERLKKHVCPFCGVVFLDAKASFDHVSKHQTEARNKLLVRYFTCNVCMHAFTSKVELIEHTVRRHPETHQHILSPTHSTYGGNDSAMMMSQEDIDDDVIITSVEMSFDGDVLNNKRYTSVAMSADSGVG